MKKIVAIIAIIVVLVLAGIAVGVHTAIDKGRPDDKGTPTEIATVADAETATVTDAETATETVIASIEISTYVGSLKNTTDETTTEEATTESNDKQDTPVSNTTPAPTTETPKPTPAPATPTTEATEAPTTEAPKPTPTPEPTTTHQHSWITITDKEAWDEPVYKEEEIMEWHWFWPDGTMCDELADPCAKVNWCGEHCIMCFPDCPTPDPAGRCAFTIYSMPVSVGTKQVQVGTTHHDAVTHQECSTCGARQ